MKRILAILGSLIVTLHFADALSEAEKDESRRNEAAQVALWEKNLEESQGKSDKEKMSELWLGLRNMGYRVSRSGHSPDVTSLYERLQAALLAIPGHAEYFAAPIWESYRAYRDPSHPKHSGSMTWFSSEAHYRMETLKHLPSPETVKVLGEMLWEEWELERVVDPRHSDMGYPSALARQAAWTLLDLPLRNKPTPFFERFHTQEYLPAWQAWYQKVKSGEISFSFVGQPVEYRFNPDGTVVRTPIEIAEKELKESEPATAGVRESARKDPAEKKVAPDSAALARPFPWVWLAAASLVAVIALGFFKMRKV